jgi:hypothetical protein
MAIVIRSEFLAEDIRKEIANKGVVPMLIDAFNKVCKENQLYNLQSSTSLADAVLKGLDAYQIHDLVNCYEQGGFDPNNKVDYTCWFEFCRPMRAELLTKEQLGELISKYAEEIAYEVLENPFEFKDIYNCYVVPMVVLQNETN